MPCASLKFEVWCRVRVRGPKIPGGRQPIDLVSVDLVVSLSRNSTPQRSLHHLGGLNREVCEPCLALPPVSGVGVHSAPIIFKIVATGSVLQLTPPLAFCRCSSGNVLSVQR